jgi:hypothetical protein
MHGYTVSAVITAIELLSIRYPIEQDSRYAIENACGNGYWPALSQIVAKGQLAYSPLGESNYARARPRSGICSPTSACSPHLKDTFTRASHSIWPRITESEQKSYDATCRKLYRFLNQPQDS